MKNGFLLLLLTLFACTAKQKESTQSDGKYITHLDKNKETDNNVMLTVDIDKQDHVSIFDLFEKIEIVPLETNDSILI